MLSLMRCKIKMPRAQTRKRAKKVSPKDGMGSISAMFQKQSESRKQSDHSERETSGSNKISVIVIESENSSDSNNDSTEVEESAPGNGNNGVTGTNLTTSIHYADNRLPFKLNEGLRYGISQSNQSYTLNSRLSLKRKYDVSKEDGSIGAGKHSTGNKIATSLDANLKRDSIEISAYNEAHTVIDRKGEDSINIKGKQEDNDGGSDKNEYTEPYYKKNFETILNTVKDDTDVSTLFSDSDNAAMSTYFSISEQAKQLYVRFFGRKFKWIPSSKIKYPEIGENLMPYLEELTVSQLLHDENCLTDLADVLETLSAGDIKSMAKTYHIASTVTQKKQTIEELLKLCRKNTVSSMFGSKGGVAASMLKKSKAMVHGAYKLEQEPRSVFIRVMMLFSLVSTTGDEDSGNGGQGQLFQMLMVNMGKVVYPSYMITKKHKVFKTRDDVIRFERALQLESDLLHATGKGDWNGAYDIYCLVSKQLDKMQEDNEIAVWNKSLPDSLRSFTAMSVLYRLMSQGIEILQRRKEYDNAVNLIKKLLDQESYCCTHRGYWWERLALNLDVHLKKPLQALEAVASGLEDELVIGGHRLALFQRAESICDRSKLKLKHRISEFRHDPLREIPKVCIEGRILHQGITSLGPRFLTEGSYTNGNAQEMTVCGVEEFVMEHYRKNGYPSGLHAEGSIVTSLFGLFFWDILFLPIPDAFHSLYQAQPLDLYTTTSFYTARKDAIDKRLADLEKSSFDYLSETMEETWNKEFGKLCVGMNWERLNSIDDMKGLVQCMGSKALSGILGRYARCPRHTRSGFPDLTLWNINTGAWKICEVKGPGDRLSHKQILWLDYLLGLGVDAEVCHVKAVAAKKLRPST